ncbi:hypothetical protein FO519_001369 [Halicephalobus sp. NKZ332]|nr:hypothetical protein FO519_001369 [Halicephalobus sp. NKZ332]
MWPKMLRYFLIASFIYVFVSASDSSEEQEECKDFVHNLVVAESPKKNYPARITNLTGVLYTADVKPSCYNKRPNVYMPGYAKMIDGELHVERDFDLVKDGYLRMTVRGLDFDDPICLNGTSQFIALPDYFCRIELCNFIGIEMCHILQRKGIHTFEELEEKLHFNRTLVLPEPPSLLGISLLDLFSGEFNFVFALETEGQTILEVEVPTNDKYLQIGVA